MTRFVETDVLVVGGAGAASMAAVHAKMRGVRTTLVCKGRLGKSGATILAGGGFSSSGESACAIGFSGDVKQTREKLFRRMVIEGFYLNNQRLVELFCRDDGERIKEVIEWGLKYSFSSPGNFSTAFPPASGGREIGRACAEGVKKNDIDVFEDFMAIDVLTHNGGVAGVFGVDINSGEFIVFRAKAVVLATGGWHQVYSFTSGTKELTGDGQAAAYRAGAELIDMEMVTFNPNVILWPNMHRGSIMPYSPGRPGKMLNNIGAEFMSGYDPKINWVASTGDFNKNIWSLATAREVAAGRGTPQGGIYWSLKHLPLNFFDDYWAKRLPNGIWQGENFSDVTELSKQGYALEVSPAAHYFEGGISINEKCETNVPGLYAAGECSSGVFGANRAGNALVEMVVLGGVAGESAAEYARSAEDAEPDVKQVEALEDKWLQPLERGREGGVKPAELRKKMQRTADASVGVIRNGSSLEKGIGEIEKLREELPRLCVTSEDRVYNREWIEAIEVENLLTCLEASARSALMRTESRGLHYRTDYLRMDNANWLREIVVKQAEGKMQLTTRPVTATTMEPPEEIMHMTWDEYMIWAATKISELSKG